jgi:hypothetical protein
MALGAHAAAGSLANSVTTTGVTSTGGAGTVFLAYLIYDGTFSSFVDSKGNTWTPVVGPTAGVGMACFGKIYKCEGGIGGAGHTFSFTTTGGTNVAVLFNEETGCVTSGAIVDQVGTLTEDNATPFTSSAITTTAANEAIYAYNSSNTGGATESWTHTDGFTPVDTLPDGAQYIATQSARLAVTSVGTYSAAYTLGVGTAAFGGVISVKLATGAPGAALAATPVASSTSTAALTTAFGGFSSNAAAGASVTAGLSTQIRLAVGASGTTAVVAALTNFASVALTAPAYTGVGGIYDPNFWFDAVPVVGNTIWFDPIISVAANGEISSAVNNCQAVVQFNSG